MQQENHPDTSKSSDDQNHQSRAGKLLAVRRGGHKAKKGHGQGDHGRDKNIPSWFWHIVAEHCVILNFLSSSCLIKFEWNIKGERYHFKAPSGDILSSLVNVPEGKRAYPSCPHTIAILILIPVC